MRRSIVLVAMLWFTVLGICQSPNDQGIAKGNRTSGSHKPGKPTESKQTAADTLPNQTIVYGQYPAPEHKGTEQQPSENVEVQRELAKFTRYLFWVGVCQFAALIVQAIVFYLTLRQIGRQAGIMEQHRVSLEQLATAASNNAGFLRSSERAWVLVTLLEPEGQHGMYEWALVLKNHGRTPARIVTAFGDTLKELELPEVPDYKTTILPSPKLLAPQEEWKIADVSSLYRTARMTYYGYVAYYDTFSEKEERVTRFCYDLVQLGGVVSMANQKWVPSGPEAYNDYS